MVPSTSDDPAPPNVTGTPSDPVYGPLASATGASFTSLTVTFTVAVSVSPSLSVIV